MTHPNEEQPPLSVCWVEGFDIAYGTARRLPDSQTHVLVDELGKRMELGVAVFPASQAGEVLRALNESFAVG